MCFKSMMTIVLKGFQEVRIVSNRVSFSVIELKMTNEAFSDVRRLRAGLKRGKHQFW